MSTHEQKRRQFLANVIRGKRFEKKEKAEWVDVKDGIASFEVATRWKRKSGKIDIKVDELGDFITIVEIKATDWDRILPYRVRPTALRHARQLWRYVDKEVEEGISVCPGLIYEKEPSDPALKAQVEEILNGRMIQVVWRNEQSPGSDK